MTSAGNARPTPSGASPPPSNPGWIPLGFLVVGALALVRASIALDLAVEGRGSERHVATFALAARFVPEVLNALVLGMVATAVAVLGVARRNLGPGARLGALAFVALVLLFALSGWPTANPRDVAGPRAAGGWPGTFWSPGVLLGLALLGAGLLAGAGRVLAARPGLARVLGSPAAIAIAALVCLGGPLGWALLAARQAPLMPLRVVVRELLVEPGALVPRAGFAAGVAPRTATLSPKVDWRYDVGDKHSLVLPPGHEVEFEVRAEDGPVRLLAAAGVDLSVRPVDDGGRFTLRFQVERNGELVFDEAREVRPDLEAAAHAWRHVGGSDGLALSPGDRVLLRTRLEPGGEPHVPADLLCGFGGLILERIDAAPRTLAGPDHPNIVLVVMDTLRADRMSCYGYAKPTTPHADRLAARGILFDEAFATSSWTWPATASILTGLDPEEHGVTSNRSCTLALANETLAEVLQARGLTTAAFSCNPLIAAERYFDQGFETFHSTPRMQMSDGIIDDVLAWLDRHADVRFFLYLQLVDPHTPHHPLRAELARLGGEMPADYPQLVHEGEPVDGMDYYTSLLLRDENLDERGAPRPELVPEAHRQWIHDVYDASVGTGDHYFGLVLERLARLGLDESTLVVFTSDHGEELFDHGCLAHGHTLHRELVRVPLVIAGPGVPAGVRAAQPVSNRHIATTLARVAGGEMRRVTDPMDLTGDLSGSSERAHFSTEKGLWNGNKSEHLYGLRDGRWTLHWNPAGRPYRAPLDAAPPGGERRLFDASSDPGERREVWLAEPSTALELESVLQRELRGQRQRRLAPAIGGGARTTHLLEGLGYIGANGEGPPR